MKSYPSLPACLKRTEPLCCPLTASCPDHFTSLRYFVANTTCSLKPQGPKKDRSADQNVLSPLPRTQSVPYTCFPEHHTSPWWWWCDRKHSKPLTANHLAAPCWQLALTVLLPSLFNVQESQRHWSPKGNEKLWVSTQKLLLHVWLSVNELPLSASSSTEW